MVKKIALLFLMLMVIVFIACGKKGPLKLEPGLEPKAVENGQVSQVGKQLKIQWDFPPTLADKNQTDLETDKIEKIYIYYSQKEITGGKFEKKSTLLRKLKLEDLTSAQSTGRTDAASSQSTPTTPTQTQTQKQKQIQPQENLSYYVMIPFKLNDLNNKSHFLGIRYYYQKKKSPLSTVLFIQTMIPVKPVTGLTITREKKVIKLNWTRPQQDENDNMVTSIAGYNIYRKIDPAAESEQQKETERETKKEDSPGGAGFDKINKDNVLTEYFEDKDTGKNGTYAYYVSTIVSNRIESEPSVPVSTQVKDIYPPEVPVNLVSFRASDHIFLTWKAAADPDLACYRIYRRSPPEKEFQLLADQITTNNYKDSQDLVTGKAYFYVVTAVDSRGNESDFSSAVKERF
jgi:predicted small lipoprotein YifL